MEAPKGHFPDAPTLDPKGASARTTTSSLVPDTRQHSLLSDRNSLTHIMSRLLPLSSHSLDNSGLSKITAPCFLLRALQHAQEPLLWLHRSQTPTRDQELSLRVCSNGTLTVASGLGRSVFVCCGMWTMEHVAMLRQILDPPVPAKLVEPSDLHERQRIDWRLQCMLA